MLIDAVRRNSPGIILYLTALLIQWRMHEYSHLLAANVTGCSILMGLDSWRFTTCNSLLMVLASGVIVNLLISLAGLYLLTHRHNAYRIFGFYLTFSGFAMNLLSSIVSVPSLANSSLFMVEAFYKAIATPILLMILLYGVKRARLNPKPSCIGWLILITIITGGVLTLIDKIFWIGYNTDIRVFKPLVGQMLITYVFDALLITILLPHALKSLKKHTDKYKNVSLF